MTTHYIYKISFPLEMSRKVYIGRSINTKNRFQRHKCFTKNKSTYAIHNAMRKYGIKNTIFEVIASCLYNNINYANETEISIISQYNSFKNGYNMTPGGEGVASGKDHPNFGKKGKNTSFFGKHHSKESKNKISISLSGKRHTEETKRKMSIAQSKTWKIYHSNGKISDVDRLELWCRENNYCRGNISAILYGRRKFHKNIIKVEQL